MEKAPRNTQMKGDEIANKKGGRRGQLGAEVKPEGEVKKKKFYFPLQQRTVEAESREAAEKIINKDLKK